MTVYLIIIIIVHTHIFIIHLSTFLIHRIYLFYIFYIACISALGLQLYKLQEIWSMTFTASQRYI